jgi:hydroxymethylpyrimidine pyrophosphatase-like HAD family hydrolase
MDTEEDEGREPAEQAVTTMTAKWLLVTDVDGTLTGDPGALAELLQAVSGRVLTVLNSSRPIASVRRTLLGFPGAWMPAGIIGALGTEIEIEGRPVFEWGQRFGAWDRNPIDAAMAEHGFTPHDDEYQTPRKASFVVPAERREVAIGAVEATGVEADVFTSGEDDFDVVPPGAGKGPAALFTARLVTAGDALIDADLVEVGRGILVGNATEEVRDAVSDEVYRASAVHAAGVLEGLRRHGVLT